MAGERAKIEQRLDIHDRIDSLELLIADVAQKNRNGGAEFTPDERKALRRVLKKNEFVERLRRLARTVLASAGATVLFFLALGDYIRLFINALKASLR